MYIRDPPEQFPLLLILLLVRLRLPLLTLPLVLLPRPLPVECRPLVVARLGLGVVGIVVERRWISSFSWSQVEFDVWTSWMFVEPVDEGEVDVDGDGDADETIMS